MTNLTVGVYAVYLIMVALRGNAGQLFSNVQTDIKGFLPWGISIGILGVLYENEKTRPVVEPFIFLIVLAAFLKNFQALKTNASQIYNSATASNATSATANSTASKSSSIMSQQSIQNLNSILSNAMNGNTATNNIH